MLGWPFEEIADARNDFNLNLTRYIDTSESEDLHDIHAHLNGGIPERDIDGDPNAIPPVPGLAAYWEVLPTLRNTLFKPNKHPGYADLAVETSEIKNTILDHPEFATFRDTIQGFFAQWRERNTPVMKAFDIDSKPKELITQIGEDLLDSFRKAPLLDPYDIYQHLMDYWAEELQDDTYEITADGWVAKPRRVLEEITSGKKKGQMKDKGWTCDLIPKPYIIARYFAQEQSHLEEMQADLESLISQQTELEEENGAEEGAFGDLEKINKGEVNKRWKEIKNDPESDEEAKVLKQWLSLDKQQSDLKKRIKDADAELDQLAYDQYEQLSLDEIKTLVVDDKWLTALEASIKNEMERVSQTLNGRVRQLAERYAVPLPEINEKIENLALSVESHFKNMGVAWS